MLLFFIEINSKSKKVSQTFTAMIIFLEEKMNIFL